MKSKTIKLLVLLLFVGLFISAAWYMFHKYSIQSPYYDKPAQEESSDPR